MMLARISRPAGALARKVPARSLTQVSSEARRYSFAHAADDIMGKRNPPADPADRMSAGAPEASPGGLSARLPPPPGSPSPPSFRLPQPSAVARARVRVARGWIVPAARRPTLTRPLVALQPPGARRR